MPIQLLVASSNPAKMQRFLELCDLADVELIMPDINQFSDIGTEPCESHLGNAVYKATAWSRRCGCIAVASDGGLIIPALKDKWHSIRTRRSVSEGGSDELRTARLLAMMSNLVDLERMAYWVEAIAIASSGTLLHAWKAEGLRGVIGLHHRTGHLVSEGFWADGIWETTEGKKRWELSEAESMSLRDPWLAIKEPFRDFLSRLP